ncbi:MAG TPA: hypothetical protein VLM11_07525 [Streptosporangiaceae bacterium]|nr:hypothetical protein [Streptosporangiaceae bacterium]
MGHPLSSYGGLCHCRAPRIPTRAVISVTEAGRELLRHRRNESTERLARDLGAAFRPAELKLPMTAAPGS